MGSAIGLRDDFDGASLRRLARLSKSANQARRLLALAQIYDESGRSEAAKIVGVTLQIVRDWVIRFNARGPDSLLDGKTRGKRWILTDAQRRALIEIVEQGPIPAIHGVVRWRLICLRARFRRGRGSGAGGRLFRRRTWAGCYCGSQSESTKSGILAKMLLLHPFLSQKSPSQISLLYAI